MSSLKKTPGERSVPLRVVARYGAVSVSNSQTLTVRRGWYLSSQIDAIDSMLLGERVTFVRQQTLLLAASNHELPMLELQVEHSSSPSLLRDRARCKACHCVPQRL